MRQVARVDSSGFFEADELIEDCAPLGPDMVESGPPDGFVVPRYERSLGEWVEGASDERLFAIAAAAKHRELVSAATEEFVGLKAGYTQTERQLQLIYDLYTMITTGSSAGMSGEADQLKSVFDALYGKLVALEAADTVSEVEELSWRS